MNILVSPLPATVTVGGTSMPIRSGYRTGVQVARTIDADLPEQMKAAVILSLYFGSVVPPDGAAAIEAVMEFHRCGRAPAKAGRRAKRLFDWDHDAGMLLADFKREYGIDLADPALRMHWFTFSAYFDNLSSESETKRAMFYRNTSRPRELKGEEAKRFSAMKKAYALPPRTKAEALEREAAMWGDV